MVPPLGLLSLSILQELPLPHHRKLVIVLAGTAAEAHHGDTASATVQRVVQTMPQLRQVVLIPLLPNLLADDIVEKCEAWMARTSAVAADDPDWKGVSIVPLTESAVVSPVTPRLLILPSAATGAAPDTGALAAYLRHTLAQLGQQLHCWALGEHCTRLAKALCADHGGGAKSRSSSSSSAASSGHKFGREVAMILVDRSGDLVQVLRHSKVTGDIVAQALPAWNHSSSDVKVCHRQLPPLQLYKGTKSFGTLILDFSACFPVCVDSFGYPSEPGARELSADGFAGESAR